MTIHVDQLKRSVGITANPQRIVSLVPSQTELLHGLGIDERVVGITKFCVHPASWLQTKTIVGGTKKIDADTIDQLKPDLIIANKEENNKDQVELLAKKYPVWISDVCNLNDALEMIESIGAITGTTPAAQQMTDAIQKNFQTLALAGKKPLRAVYLVWRKPYMAAGADTFIHSMMTACGFDNILSNRLRYPKIKVPEDFGNCELVLLPSEPFPFADKHRRELKAFLPEKKIILVDGEMFSWYGSRLLKSPAYFMSLLEEIQQ